MSLELYGTHLESLELTDQEKAALIDDLSVVIEHVLKDLFTRDISHENNQSKTD